MTGPEFTICQEGRINAVLMCDGQSHQGDPDPSWLSFVSVCQSVANAAVTSPKPAELQPVVQSTSVEMFDMSYADEDGAWTVPEGELRGINLMPSDRPACAAACLSTHASNFAAECNAVRKCEVSKHVPARIRHALMTQKSADARDELHVRAVTTGLPGTTIELVIDSGSDESCLPESWRHVGVAGGTTNNSYRDAQGSVISGSQMRTAVLDIDGVQFKERWLLGSVAQPLFSVGKLLKRGWNLIHTDNTPFLTSPDNAIRVPLHYRHNSLHATGTIMNVSACFDREGDRAVMALTVGDVWLSLPDNFVEVQPGIFARRDYTTNFLGVTVPLGHKGVAYRTTLQQRPTGWQVIEVNSLVENLDQADCEIAPPVNRQTITIGSVHPVNIDSLFSRVPNAMPSAAMHDDDFPDVPDDAMNFEEHDEHDENVAAGDDGGGVGPLVQAEDVPAQGHVIVNGIELHLGCTLSTLRTACQVLGIGKSGGKKTVLQRIEQHLKTQELLQQHEFQTDGREPLREQKFVEAPTAEEQRRHELSHMPYADWCPHCVRFRAKADKHVRVKPDVREDSVCCMDFAYTGRRTPAQFEGHMQEKLVVLVLKDSHTGAVHAIPTPAKGGTIAFKYLVAETCRFLNYCGHQTCTIRSDSEPACLALQRGIKAFRSKMGLQTHLEQTEASDHQGNEAEQSIDGIRQLAGCILDQFEERAETTIGSSHPMHAYAWRHAAWLHTRMSRQNDLSAFHVINGRPYLGKLVCFGETVFARVKSSIKGKARWCKMLWLGKLPVSDLHFGVTEGGYMLSSRSIRRLPKQYLATMCASLVDMPWTQASFLAGQVGQARKQKTQAEALSAGGEEASEAAREQVAEVPSQQGASERPMPFPEHLLPDDAMLSELVPPPPRIPAAYTPEPPTPMSSTPLQPPQAETPIGVAPLDSPMASMDQGEDMLPPGVVRHAAEHAGGDAPARKKLRLDALQVSAHDAEMFHLDESIELVDESAEQFLDCEDQDDNQSEWAEQPGSDLDIPSILIKPFSEIEPQCSASEQAEIDAAADAFELARLLGSSVLEQMQSWQPGHRTLSSKYVRSWRAKTLGGEKKWLRRSRLVAREFAHLDPERQHLFAPTTTQCMLRIIPALFVRHFHEGWALMSLDVSDAFLQCKQEHETLTKVNGQWFRLLRMLPGQRDGSATWFRDFMQEIKTAVEAEPLAEQPVLFRIPKPAGAGMVHVDDMLCTGPVKRLEDLERHLKSKFKVSVDWIRSVGEEVTFLKRRHVLVSPELLVVEPDVKYLDKLLQVTGLSGAKARSKAAPFPTGGLPTDSEPDPELDPETATRYRSALGILMYLSVDLLASQFGIRYLATRAHKPTQGCWKLLRHLTSYVSSHRSHVIGLSKPTLGKGLVCNRVSEHKTSVLEMFSDSDWSGDKRTRRSVSACCVVWDGQLLYSSSHTQKVISLSSCEAEYNSLVAGSATAILLQNCICHVCPDLDVKLSCLCDNAAARSLGNRQGVGRTRHIDGKLLWLQQKTQEKLLEVIPVGTRDNVSDLPTKALKPERIEFLLGRLNVRCKDNGFQVVSESELLDHESRRKICRVVKKGSVNVQQVLQVLALILQLDSIAGANPDEPNTSADALGQNTSDEADGGYESMLWSFLEKVLHAIFLIHDFMVNHPQVSLTLIQIVIFVAMCICFCCRRNRATQLRETAEAKAGSAPTVRVHVEVSGVSVPKPAEIPTDPNLNLPQQATDGDASEDEPDPTAGPSSAAPGTDQPSAPLRTPDLPPIRDPDEHCFVFVTASRGYAFHRVRGCPQLKCAKRVLRYSKREAMRRGYQPCKVCGG